MKRGKAGRPAGTTKERKPIRHEEFSIFMRRVEESGMEMEKKRLVSSASMLLRYGGFRVGELVNLRVRDLLTLEEFRTISLTNNTKTKKPRDAYFSEKRVAEILPYFDWVSRKDPEALLFPGRGGRYDRRNPQSFTHILNGVLHKLLGTQYSTHSFRAGHITDLHDAGVSTRVIQGHIGHTSVATTMRYIHVTDEAKRAAVDML